MQEPKTGLWVAKRLKKDVLRSLTGATQERDRLTKKWGFCEKRAELTGKIKALQNVHDDVVLLEVLLEEEAERLRQMVDVYGNLIREPHLIDL